MFHHVLVRFFDHRCLVVRTDAGTETEEEKTIEIIDFRDGTDRRAGIVGDGFLLDADGRSKSFDFTDFCLFAHTADKHTGIGREGLQIASLTFITERREGEGRFTGSADAGEDGQCIFGERDVDVPQVMRRDSEKIDGIGHRKAI